MAAPIKKAGFGAFERPKTKPIKILRRLWKYLTEYKWLLIAALALSLFSNFFSLIGPMLSGKAIDAIEPGAGKVDFKTVFFYAGLMLMFYLLSAVMSYILSMLMVQISRNTIYKMRNDVFEHLMKLPVSFYDKNAVGDVLSVLSYDIDNINASLSNDVVHIFTSVITVVFSFTMMLTISPQLITVFIVTIPISILFTRFRSKKVRPLYRERSKNLGLLNGYVEEMTGGLKTIKGYGRENEFHAEFDTYNQNACQANYIADRFSSSTGPSVNFINNLSLALVSMFGALLYMNGAIRLGNISSFVLYSRKFSGPINEFANIFSELQSALASAERVFRLLDEPTEKADKQTAKDIKDVKGHIELKDVTFGYTDTPVLKNLNLEVKPGQTVAIVGPTGSGKTTIISILMRFYDINSGKIFVDGTELSDITRKSMRKAYSMVLQDTWLFSDTIYNNLTYGNSSITMEEVKRATRAAKIDSFIDALPDGYDTILSDGGTSISKGQKQLLTIARAMLLDAPMLILDEATSNVDTQTERLIQSAMLKLMQGRTCIVIAHRLSTIKNADCIAVLRDGTIAESGTHDELMKKKGYYCELYKAQFDTTDK